MSEAFSAFLTVKAEPKTFEDDRETYRFNVQYEIQKAQGELLELFMQEYDRRNSGEGESNVSS